MARVYIPKINYIRPEVWKRITSVIKDYNELKKEYEQPQVVSEISLVWALEAERKIKAFESAWKETDEDTQRLVRLRYWENKTYRDMWMPMSESTMKRLVRTYVERLGKMLGEID
jgi:hypothetical protein